MRELSIFADEAGQQDMSDGYYLLTLVVHDQSEPIGEHIEEYERQLQAGGLPDIALHMVCLLHGHGDYEGLDSHTRKGLLFEVQRVRTASSVLERLDSPFAAISFPSCKRGCKRRDTCYHYNSIGELAHAG